MMTLTCSSQFKADLSHPLSRARLNYISGSKQFLGSDARRTVFLAASAAVFIFVCATLTKAWFALLPATRATQYSVERMHLRGAAPFDRDSFLQHLSREE